MRIQHNITALNAHRNLSNNNSFVGKNLEKLSSGYKINRAGDDAAGLAISEKMRAQITGLETAQKNAQDGVSLVQTAEGALTEVHSMLNRMVELVGETSADFNQIGVTLGRMHCDAMGGTIQATGANKGQMRLVKDIDITDVTGAKEAIDIANGAIDAISSMRSTFGALQNRLDHTINNLGVQTENITAAESRIRDVDMAKEMMAYTKNNILVQASQAMLAQANQVPQGVLQLLQ